LGVPIGSFAERRRKYTVPKLWEHRIAMKRESQKYLKIDTGMNDKARVELEGRKAFLLRERKGPMDEGPDDRLPEEKKRP